VTAGGLDEVGDRGAVVAVNGVRLFVRRLGDPQLPPLVIVHGGPTWDHSYLASAVAGLTDVAHVVLFDLRGCGRSERTAPFGALAGSQLQPDLLADDVAALVRGLGRPADVLGFSFGGRVAMRVVEQHPGVVRRLVLASTTAFTDFEDELHGCADYVRRRAMSRVVGFDEPDDGDGSLSRAMAYGGAPLEVWRLDRLDEWHEVLARVRFTSDYNRPYRSGELRGGGPDDPVAVLRGWGRPVLILHGAHDLGFPVGVARRLHVALPHSTLAVIAEAGHMAHFDNLSPWLAAIRDFLR
jgi:pimeloyl-ACP methyl ester carboxylesterase